MTWTRSLLLPALVTLSIGCGATAERDPPLQFSSAVLPNATVNQPYQAVIAVTNAITPLSSVEVVAGALPAGITVEVLLPLETKELRFIGTPAAAGSASFTIRASCFGTNRPGQQGEQAYTLLVVP